MCRVEDFYDRLPPAGTDWDYAWKQHHHQKGLCVHCAESWMDQPAQYKNGLIRRVLLPFYFFGNYLNCCADAAAAVVTTTTTGRVFPLSLWLVGKGRAFPGGVMGFPLAAVQTICFVWSSWFGFSSLWFSSVFQHCSGKIYGRFFSTRQCRVHRFGDRFGIWY